MTLMRRTEDRPDRIAWEVHTSMGDMVELQFMIDGAALRVGEVFVPLSIEQFLLMLGELTEKD